jgi:hypothetical protein
MNANNEFEGACKDKIDTGNTEDSTDKTLIPVPPKKKSHTNGEV